MNNVVVHPTLKIYISSSVIYSRIINIFFASSALGLLGASVAKVVGAISNPETINKTDIVVPILSIKSLMLFAAAFESIVVIVCLNKKISRLHRLLSLFVIASAMLIYRVLHFAVSGKVFGCSCLAGLSFGSWDHGVQIGLLVFLGTLLIGSAAALVIEFGAAAKPRSRRNMRNVTSGNT